MKQLEKEFEGKGEVRGYYFKQLFCVTNKAYLYEVTSINTLHYEVFKHRENDLYETVSYPSSKQFGISAWTTPIFSRAIEIYNEISK